MPADKCTHKYQICFPVKHGELKFEASIVDMSGVSWLFIIRKLKLFSGGQRISTEQHIRIGSHVELAEWIARDAYSQQCEGLFQDLMNFSREVFK